MANKFAGLKRVGYSDAGSNPTWIAGKVSSDSDFTPSVTEKEITDGVLFGGGGLEGEIMLLDHADYSTLEGFMTANSEKFWHFEYNDGTVLVTARSFNVFVRKTGGVNARDGLVEWVLSFTTFHSAPVL